jgi:hypothetical protein
MCPACIATALLIVGSVTSTGGLAVIAMKQFGNKKAHRNSDTPTLSPIATTHPNKEDHHG